MKEYYEANSTSGDFIRMDITDKNTTNKDKILSGIKLQFSGSSYTLTQHFCNHDIDRPCTITQL